MCLFLHEWKVKSTKDVDPLVIYYAKLAEDGSSPQPWMRGEKIPLCYFERKLQVLRECANCGTQEVKIVEVDP